MIPGRPLFATALKAALQERGWTQMALARETGADPTSVCDWVNGRKIPRGELLQRVTDALMAPQLVDAAVRARTSRCLTCDAVVVSIGSRPRLYCSPACKVTASNRKRRGTTEKLATVARHRLEMYQEAVAAYCRWCQPNGWCEDSECSLRPISPLPLVAKRAA